MKCLRYKYIKRLERKIIELEDYLILLEKIINRLYVKNNNLLERNIKYEKGLDSIMSDDSGRVREYVND